MRGLLSDRSPHLRAPRRPIETGTSRPPVESEVAVRESVVAVVAVVGAVVVVAAEQHCVVEVGVAAVLPRFEVVGLGPGGRNGAPLGAAALVADPQGLALGRVEQSLG